MRQRTDAEFIEAIDACFPISDRTAALELISESQELSENAALMIVHELVCTSAQPRVRRLALLKELTGTGRKALLSPRPSQER